MTGPWDDAIGLSGNLRSRTGVWVMRVSVIINAKAGNLNLSLVREKVDQALFRCQKAYCVPNSIRDISTFVKKEILLGTNYILICGGDGTVNYCLSGFIETGLDYGKIPPICIVCTGTANDLANDLGISKKIDEAARTIFLGDIKVVDVISVKSKQKTSYMLTNGGVGIPALTAQKSNLYRQKIKEFFLQKDFPDGISGKVLKIIGSDIYNLTLLESFFRWDHHDWEIQIELDGQRKISTRSPFILVNNQPTLGKNFITAPYTTNNDGLINLLVINAHTKAAMLAALLRIKRQRSLNPIKHPSYETRSVIIKSKNRPLTFFGDGEVLVENTNEIKVNVINPGLAFVVPKLNIEPRMSPDALLSMISM